MNKKITLGLLLVLVVALVGVPEALARSDYLTAFETKYPSAMGTKLDNCDTCHAGPVLFSVTGSSKQVNYYGRDYNLKNHDFAAIEGIDSDGDGFTNIDEINALTFPGDPNDKPATGDTQAPTSPSGLTATAVSSNEVDLSWTASTDNAGVTGYYVYRSTDGVNFNQIANIAATSYKDTTVSPNTAYYYYVEAFDAAGNISGASNSASITTPPTPTATVTFTVTDSLTNLPIQGASVVMDGSKLKTDNNGKAVFNNVANGNHKYTVSKRGYKRTSGIVNVNNADASQSVQLTSR